MKLSRESVAQRYMRHSLPEPFTITNAQLTTAETESPFTYRNRPSELYRLPNLYKQAAVPIQPSKRPSLPSHPPIIPTRSPNPTSYHNITSSTPPAGRNNHQPFHHHNPRKKEKKKPYKKQDKPRSSVCLSVRQSQHPNFQPPHRISNPHPTFPMSIHLERTTKTQGIRTIYTK